MLCQIGYRTAQVCVDRERGREGVEGRREGGREGERGMRGSWGQGREATGRTGRVLGRGETGGGRGEETEGHISYSSSWGRHVSASSLVVSTTALICWHSLKTLTYGIIQWNLCHQVCLK